MKPKKNLGQNFLKNEGEVKKIVSFLNIKNNDTIIEIGTGHGEITKRINREDKNLQIITTEKDISLYKSLNFKKIGENSIDSIMGDALLLLPKLIDNYKLHNKGYKIVGNIPYYITGYLLRTIGNLKKKPSLTILTIQKEVAIRICATPPKTNLLSASVQIWANCKILDFISKKNFFPIPKVDSAIISLVTNPLSFKNDSNYYKFIKILFKQPRKTILNNLRESNLSKEKIYEVLSKNNTQQNDRPQNLDIETIKNIYKIVYNLI